MTNEQKIQHLYWRAGFGLSPDEFQKKKKQPLDKVIKSLFKGAKKITPVKIPHYNMPSQESFKKMSKTERREKLKETQQLTTEVNLNWVRQMVSDDYNCLQEKMTLFWHGHFACESKRFDHAARQINTIRQYALGNFRDLVLAISKDAAMIIYLNNQQNKKDRPNENYARELMELFTIGRGNYTEQDIKEAARAFTGWFSERFTGEFKFTERQHDFGQKTFMGRTGDWNGDDIIDIILERKETATYLATKVYRYFVNEKVDEQRVEILATVLYQSNYHIETMMRTLFESSWFYEPQNVGVKIKSPIELLVGMGKVLGINFGNKKSVLFSQLALGQVLFRPPNVAGWPGGKTWIDNSTLMLRINFAALIFQKAALNLELKDQPERGKGGRLKDLEISGSIAPIANIFQATSTTNLGQALGDYILQTRVTIQGSFIEQLAEKESNYEGKITAYILGIMSLPEYQMC
ncbi:DUF1800 domain-containing protein [Aureispira anguillae]|uniref:DUF1800 domain-containing protein n=1 Tax=Aureispira anguillae TaxID=2864201 RepID=A0A915YBC1_9BACT|nr:DUF1800 domain-containing protein [Aureispira anguillae]BDS09934.1 DUF1800 domain-containing protein [Aureispira anguillae]